MYVTSAWCNHEELCQTWEFGKAYFCRSSHTELSISSCAVFYDMYVKEFLILYILYVIIVHQVAISISLRKWSGINC